MFLSAANHSRSPRCRSQTLTLDRFNDRASGAFLGFTKRRQELRLLGKEAVSHRGVLAHYNTYFIDQIIMVLTASILVVYLLYTIDPRTLVQFGSQKIMLSIPFVYYGIFRYLYLIHKIRKDGDLAQILFLTKRYRSILCYGFSSVWSPFIRVNF